MIYVCVCMQRGILFGENPVLLFCLSCSEKRTNKTNPQDLR